MATLNEKQRKALVMGIWKYYQGAWNGTGIARFNEQRNHVVRTIDGKVNGEYVRMMCGGGKDICLEEQTDEELCLLFQQVENWLVRFHRAWYLKNQTNIDAAREWHVAQTPLTTSVG